MDIGMNRPNAGQLGGSAIERTLIAADDRDVIAGRMKLLRKRKADTFCAPGNENFMG